MDVEVDERRQDRGGDRPPATAAGPAAAHGARAFTVGLALLAGLAAALRGVHLGAEELWLDEATTALWATLPPAELFVALRDDVQLPLYHVIEALWLAPVARADVTPLLLRLPSAAFGVLTVVVVAALGRRLLSARAGLFAGLLIAVTPAAVHYGREARSYALAVLLVALGTAAIARLEARPTTGRALLAGLACAALFYAHGLAPLALVAVAAWPLARAALRRDGPRLRAWGLVVAVTAVAAAAWLPVVGHQVGVIGTSYSWASAHWHELFPWQPAAAIAALSPGGSAPHRNLVRHFPPESWAGAALLLLLGALALRHRRQAERPAAAPWLAASTATYLALLFAASVVASPVHVVGRTDVLALPWLALLGGAGLAAIRPRWLGVLAAVLAVALAVPSLREEIGSGRRSVDAALVRSVASHVAAGDVLIFAGSFQPTLEWYLPREVAGVTLLGFPGSRDDGRQWVDWQRYEREGLDGEAGRVAGRALALATARGTRAWLLYDSATENVPLLRALSARARLELVARYPWEVGLFRIGLAPGG